MITKRSIVLITIIVFLASAVVSASKKTDGTPPRGVPPATNPVFSPQGAPEDSISIIENMGYGDFRGVIHAHSWLSHDSEGTPSRMIQAAQTVGIKFILMTDHPSQYAAIHGLRGMHGGVLFLPGEELNRGGASLLAIDLTNNIKSPDTQDTIDEIHAQGGLAFLSHVEGFEDWDVQRYDGMEIYNAHYDAILDGKVDKTIALVPLLEKNPDRVWLSILDRPDLYLKKWDEQLKTHRATGVAANDSHENVVYNGFQLDTYERSYGLVSTHLFLMELTEAEVLRALRRGNGYVCFDVFASCRGFAFTATDGKIVAIMGDDYSLGGESPSTLDVSLPSPAQIKLVKDGEILTETEGQALSIELKQPGVYRVEAYIKTPKAKKPQPWIYSNPIYVR